MLICHFKSLPVLIPFVALGEFETKCLHKHKLQLSDYNV